MVASRIRSWPGSGHGRCGRNATNTVNASGKRLEPGIFGISWKESLAGDLILGGKDFVAKVRKMLKGNRTEQKSLRALEKPPVDWMRIIGMIEKMWDEPWEKISQRHGDPGRELAMLIARRVRGNEFARDR